MSLNKIITFTIVASFVVLGIAQTATADDFTVDQIVGNWYHIAQFHNGTVKYSCRVFNAFKDDKQNGFSVTFNSAWGTQRERLYRTMFRGTISNSEMEMTYPFHGSDVHMHFRVISRNSGQELILLDTENNVGSVLLSRKQTASVETRAEFKSIAERAGYSMEYEYQNLCGHFHA